MNTTHFGYETVDENLKSQRVRGVFNSVSGISITLGQTAVYA